MNFEQLPRNRYTEYETLLVLLKKLSEKLQGPEIWMKQDDCLGLAAGGSKTRKLEYLIADAQLHNADTIITSGAIQSNHCRLTLSAAKKEGLK